MKRWLARFLLIALFPLAVGAGHGEGDVQWQDWSQAAFRQAKQDNRFVILDLQAVWCHWCHVMDDTTYRDPKVVSLLKQKYVALRVDQDANPDLSTRYGDWGWPATIIFAADGTELVKRRGYIPPENMASLLQAVIDDPTPGPSVTAATTVTPSMSTEIEPPALRALEQSFLSDYDNKNGGWGVVHKFIDVDRMDWALRRAEGGDATAALMAKTTLNRALALIDPAWGGLYQYSDAQDWSSPHYEKIMWYQANGLRQYAKAYAMFKDPAYLQAAKAIYGYLSSKLLSPEGAFYCSQDADVDEALPGKDFYRLTDTERRKLGRQPTIDTHLYARENGWAIMGLVAYADATGDPMPLAQAKRAADWVIAHRRRPDGLFTHSEHDRGGPFIEDTVAMSNAALDLYAATGERKWISVAQESQKALAGFGDASGGGYRTSMTLEGSDGTLAKSLKSLDVQVSAARLAVRLWRYLGDPDSKQLAEHAMKYLASPDVIEGGRLGSGYLLAADEFAHEPTHITIVGPKDDTAAQSLHVAARMYPASNKRLDWWDRREGPLPNSDITYPEMDEAAAFACGNRLCSFPVFTAKDLSMAIAQMSDALRTNAAR